MMNREMSQDMLELAAIFRELSGKPISIEEYHRTRNFEERERVKEESWESDAKSW